FAPEDGDERSHLAHVLAGEPFATSRSAREQALFNVERVLRKEPDRADERRLAVRLAMELGRYDIAGSHLDALLKGAPDDGELARMKAQLCEAKGQPSAAGEWYRKAI